MELQLRIRELREAKGWTLERLAGIVGVSVPHLSGVERGVKNVNNHLIIKISKALAVQPHELFARPSDQESALVGAMQALSADDQARVIAFARALSASQQD